MRIFYLYRVKDISGVSGTGIVAEGCQFSDQRCVLRWIGDISSLVIYANIHEVKAIHGHNGATCTLWDDLDVIDTETGEAYQQEPGTGFVKCSDKSWAGRLEGESDIKRFVSPSKYLSNL